MSRTSWEAVKRIVWSPRVVGQNLLRGKVDVKVGQKIALGYAIALGTAILGTGAGVLIGHYYESQAERKRKDVLEEIRLSEAVQHHLLLAQVNQYRLVSMLLYPERLQQRYGHFREHLAQTKTAWTELKASSKQPQVEETPGELEAWNRLLKYDGLLDDYLKEVDYLVNRFDLLNLSSERIDAARERLLVFNGGSMGLKLLEFTEALEELVKITSQEEAEAEAALQRARMLRYQLTILSATASITMAIWLAWYTTRAIAHPVRELTTIAQTATQHSNFTLQAPVTTHDEVGQLALSFNHLIERVRLLLLEKEQQTLELEMAREAIEQMAQAFQVNELKEFINQHRSER